MPLCRCSNEVGCQAYVKIEGGPGRPELNSLAELRSRGMYLFPCVQNTTHSLQETDQSYGHLKSLLKKCVQVQMNELTAQARKGSNPGATMSFSHILWYPFIRPCCRFRKGAGLRSSTFFSHLEFRGT